jgi:serine protease SohB
MVAVGTGEHWYGEQAKGLGLIDEIQTSDEYLLARCADASVFHVRFNARKTLSDKLAQNLTAVGERAIFRLWELAKLGSLGF